MSPSLLPLDGLRTLAVSVPDVGALLRAALPEVILSTGILLLVVLEAFLGKRARLAPRISVVTVMATLAVVFLSLREPGAVEPQGPLLVDRMASIFRIFFLASAGLSLMFAMRRAQDWFDQSEFHVLLLGSLVGMSALSAAVDVLTAYLAFELVSYSGYLMVGYRKGERGASEAGLKYVIFGAVASGAMLYGLTYLVGIGGTTSMAGIAEALRIDGPSPAALAAAVLVFAGFAFKVSAVPFHFWAPDAYEGAPTVVAGFLATASKAAGFAIAVRILGTFGGPADAVPADVSFGFLPPGPLPHWLIGVGAVATMVVGNTAALRQQDLRRMLAWSSIAHAGYLLMALTVADGAAMGAVLFYFWVYLLMTVGGFGIVGLLRPVLGGTEMRHYNGLARRRPLIAVMIAVLMISLAGLPPTAGFWGKVLLFKPVIDARLYGLAVVGLLTSAISLYYYAGLMRAMFLQPPPAEEPAGDLGLMDTFLIGVCTAPLLVGGLGGFAGPAEALLRAATDWVAAMAR